MGMAWNVTKFVARHTLGRASKAAIDRAKRARCEARTGRGNRVCGKRIRLGRTADGVTCGSEMCQLWLMSHDEQATAHYLGISVRELAERVQGAREAA